ncbi:Nicotinamide riboside transporter PnuC [Novipirellula aureliae]|uniref:Nicotinamide riboside transporter PnuC n=1 Tax=Novipirellula aureliae TaxID=2527966 RepID=A0A5C6DTF5_9BACT|nr:nicotinamide riboside transporter PnuC [Novipirellula aureliae]TWU40010.1 Nicotinamide riboside transporter PnuC [Novipirellula aureliae]
MNLIELAATVFGFLCVLLTIRRSVWCWPIGLVQVTLFIFVFYDAKLYSDLLLHVVYVFLQFYGWYCWTRDDAIDKTLVVQSLPASRLAIWIAIVAIGTAGWGWAMSRWTDASLPYPDAFTTVASLVAQFLLARRYVQNWAFWIAVDVVAIWVYFTKELNATAVLYIAFLILASIGLAIWKQRLAIQSCPASMRTEGVSA